MGSVRRTGRAPPSCLARRLQEGVFLCSLGTDAERLVSPEHHNYQVRLRRYLESKKVPAEFEKDFIDVQFVGATRKFIWEIKVTGWLRIEQAFRVALGQLLEYANLKFSNPVGMVMFLDAQPDPARLELARKLSIAVVVERDSKFTLINPATAPDLKGIFP
jgi:hypothetical protein